MFSFTPASIAGMAEHPLPLKKAFYGLALREYDTEELIKSQKLNIQWMIELYKAYPDKSKFFDKSQSNQIGDINKLAGVYEFKKQIESGVSEEAIRKTWEPGLSKYKEMRQQYLIYP